MRRFIIVFMVIINLQPVFADIIRTSPFYNRPNFKYNVPHYQRNKHYVPRRNYRINNYNNKIYNQHCPHCHSNNFYHRPIKINNLKKLERYAMNQTFANEDDITRLERLENLAFGAIQNGNFNNRYANVESAILSRPKYKTKNTILNTLSNIITGQATGFTPNITTNELNGHDNFAPFGGDYFSPTIRPYPSYNNNMVEQYSNGIFSGGWTNLGNDYGTGSSIRMLD